MIPAHKRRAGRHPEDGWRPALPYPSAYETWILMAAEKLVDLPVETLFSRIRNW
jgi:hypothetical protein